MNYSRPTVVFAGSPLPSIQSANEKKIDLIYDAKPQLVVFGSALASVRSTAKSSYQFDATVQLFIGTANAYEADE